MTLEERQLLLKDLCARLPYGVKILDIPANVVGELFLVSTTDTVEYEPVDETNDINWCQTLYNIKPYLRPMSSMMQGEWEQMSSLIYPHGRVNRNPENKDKLLLWLCSEGNDMPISLMDDVFSWLNVHHFDYRGLIPMGLALEAKEGMYEVQD